MFAEITSNTVDTHNVAVKDATVTNDTTNERLSILNVDDNLKNNQSNMEFVDNDSNTDNINEGYKSIYSRSIYARFIVLKVYKLSEKYLFQRSANG